ncbi:unnamed protein product [Calypogeia fissa]
MADFGDLELILDTNLDRVGIGADAPLVDFRRSAIQNVSDETRYTDQSGGQAEVTEHGGDGHEVRNEAAVYGLGPSPVPGAASLSLALSSMLSLNVVAPPSTRSVKLAAGGQCSSTTKKVAVAKAADTSARSALNPSPVVGSAKMQAAAAPAPQSVQNGSKVANFISPFPDYQRLRDGKFGEPKNPAGLRRATIVWFRNDLRVHDNEALVNASNESMSILPVYCFDPRDYGKSSSGFDKTGPYRAKFLLECVASLRENLRQRGSELIVRIGKPEEVLVTLAKSVGADALYAHQEVAIEEMVAEAKVTAALKEEGVEAKFFWGSTLFHIDDLPFKLEEMPSNYGGFREKVQQVDVRATIPAPKQLKGLPIRGSVKAGDIPSLQDLGLNPTSAKRPQEKNTPYGGALLVGGEEEALQRLKSFSIETSSLSTSKNSDGKKTGDSIYGANFSCKISPWLAMGCLSPRRMFEDLKTSTSRSVSASAGKSAVTGVQGDGLNWLVFELLWRDFFRFITKKFGDGKRLNDSSPATACTGLPVPA